MALQNVHNADALVLQENQDAAFTALARFHFNLSLPSSQRRHRNSRRYDNFTVLTEEETGWLKMYLQDEIEVYNVAKTVAQRQYRTAVACTQLP